MNDFSIFGYLVLVSTAVLAVFGIVSKSDRTNRFSIPVFIISVSLFLGTATYQSITGKSPIDIIIEKIIDPVLRVFGVKPASDQNRSGGITGVGSAPLSSDPIKWKLARGDRNNLGFGLVAHDLRTDVVFSIYCNRSFDEGGWNISLRFLETPMGRDSFKRITGSFQPLYGTYRTFEFDIFPNFSFSIPLQISPSNNQAVQMVFRSEPPGAGGRAVLELIALLFDESSLSTISFEGFDLIGAISENGFSELLTREAVSDDCSLDQL